MFSRMFVFPKYVMPWQYQFLSPVTQISFQCSFYIRLSVDFVTKTAFTHRGPSPNGRKAIGCRFAFSSAENLDKSSTFSIHSFPILIQPLWYEFLWIRPDHRIMMQCIHRYFDYHPFRYATVTKLIVIRCHTIKSIENLTFQSTEFQYTRQTSSQEDTFEVFHWWPYLSMGVDWCYLVWSHPKQQAYFSWNHHAEPNIHLQWFVRFPDRLFLVSHFQLPWHRKRMIIAY